MTRDQFWQIVDESTLASGDDQEHQLEHVAQALANLEPAEIVAFDMILDDALADSYRSDLWAAAYIINGGCSDDGFEYFRAWLISRGRDVFEAALQDPGTLEHQIRMDGDWDAEFEEFLYLPRQVYETQTGDEMPARPVPKRTLQGPDWDEDTVDELFPRLAEKAQARFS